MLRFRSITQYNKANEWYITVVTESFRVTVTLATNLETFSERALHAALLPLPPPTSPPRHLKNGWARILSVATKNPLTCAEKQ